MLVRDEQVADGDLRDGEQGLRDRGDRDGEEQEPPLARALHVEDRDRDRDRAGQAKERLGTLRARVQGERKERDRAERERRRAEGVDATLGDPPRHRGDGERQQDGSGHVGEADADAVIRVLVGDEAQSRQRGQQDDREHEREGSDPARSHCRRVRSDQRRC